MTSGSSRKGGVARTGHRQAEDLWQTKQVRIHQKDFEKFSILGLEWALMSWDDAICQTSVLSGALLELCLPLQILSLINTDKEE